MVFKEKIIRKHDCYKTYVAKSSQEAGHLADVGKEKNKNRDVIEICDELEEMLFRLKRANNELDVLHFPDGEFTEIAIEDVQAEMEKRAYDCTIDASGPRRILVIDITRAGLN